MSYTPTEWESADIVTATRMNRLETAVGDANMSYTPNTWSDGDILTASKMNALEQAVAGGGGSSDFSTAEVTISTGNTTGIFIPIAQVRDYEGGDGQINVSSIPPNTSPTEYKIPLYKGVYHFTVFDVAVAVTGDIEAEGEDYDEYDIYIRGNGTITISAT